MDFDQSCLASILLCLFCSFNCMTKSLSSWENDRGISFWTGEDHEGRGHLVNLAKISSLKEEGDLE